MGGPHVDALRISPRYTSEDWYALSCSKEGDWSEAAEILKDRLVGRFFRYAGNCLRSPHSGFVVLAIDSLLVETVQQFREGVIDGHGQSRKLVTAFLEGPRFQPEFDRAARAAYYTDIRCGLLHQAEAKRTWLIRRGEPRMLHSLQDGNGYVIDVRLFHQAVRRSFDDYLRQIVRLENEKLRDNLWTKMNHICSVRTARGAVYAADGSS
jgi:hypothetical protein